MAALFHDNVLDAALDVIKVADSLRICKGAPTTYAQVVVEDGADGTLAEVALAGGDFTANADATPNGRWTIVSAKANVPVVGTGEPTQYCLVDTSNSRLLAMTDVNPASPQLTEGSTTDIPAVTFSIADPTVVI